MQWLWCLDVAFFMFMTSAQYSLYNKGFAIRWCLVLTWGGYLGKSVLGALQILSHGQRFFTINKNQWKARARRWWFHSKRSYFHHNYPRPGIVQLTFFLLTCFPKELSVVCRCPWLNQSVQLSALVSRSLASMDQEGWVVHRDSVAVTFCTHSCHSENISPVSLANGEDKGLIRILVIVSDKSSQEIIHQHKPCGLHLYLETEFG